MADLYATFCVRTTFGVMAHLTTLIYKAELSKGHRCHSLRAQPSLQMETMREGAISQVSTLSP